MAVLVEDLVEDILTRLPVKSLLRNKCVCKRWYALINSNAFVKQHTSCSILSNTRNRVLIIEEQLSLYSLPLYSLNRSRPVLLARPMPETELNLRGSSNGLLCLCSGKVGIIWNPTTRKHVKVPVLNDVEEMKEGNMYYYLSGFGYDSVSDDYKLVKVLQIISYGENLGVRMETNIYSLRSHSWRKSEHTSDNRISNVQSVFTCGALHWVGQRRPEPGFETSSLRIIIAFDLATEEYMVITPPECVTTFSVWDLGGCLSIVCNKDFSSGHDVDVWMMNEYGVTESWTKLLNISKSEVSRSLYQNKRKGKKEFNRYVSFCVKPLVYTESECGDEVLLMVNNLKKLIWYNLKNRTFKFANFCGLPPMYYRPLICLESLVSLGGRAENDDRQGGV